MARIFREEHVKFESLKKDDVGNMVLKVSTDKLNLTLTSPDKQREHTEWNKLQEQFNKGRNIIISIYHPCDRRRDNCAEGALYSSDDKTLLQVHFRDGRTSILGISSICCNAVCILPKNPAYLS
jgi:hypothetical protein